MNDKNKNLSDIKTYDISELSGETYTVMCVFICEFNKLCGVLNGINKKLDSINDSLYEINDTLMNNQL